MKSRREVGTFQVQQGSRTSSNISKEKLLEERFPRLDEEKYVSLPRTYSDTCTVFVPTQHSVGMHIFSSLLSC